MIAELNTARPLFIPAEINQTSGGILKLPADKSAIVKPLLLPPPPDDKRIEELNKLATASPFCATHKVKKHDPL